MEVIGGVQKIILIQQQAPYRRRVFLCRARRDRYYAAHIATTLFLLIAAGLFLRSSGRLYLWLTNAMIAYFPVFYTSSIPPDLAVPYNDIKRYEQATC